MGGIEFHHALGRMGGVGREGQRRSDSGDKSGREGMRLFLGATYCSVLENERLDASHTFAITQPQVIRKG